MAIRATRRVSNNDHAPGKKTVANDSLFTVLLADVLYLKGDALEDRFGICEVQTSFSQSLVTLDWIKGDTHLVIVSTTTFERKPDRP